MNIGGYFPLRTERERFDLRVNAGWFDDISDTFSDAFGTSSSGSSNDDRGFFEQGPTQGGRGSETFANEKSRAQLAAGQAIGSIVGAGLGIPGLGTLAGRNTTTFTDSRGNRINQGAGNSGDDNSLRGGSNVAVTVNQAGQLVDNSGNIVNQQGQRLDENGRVLSDADIAIQQALGFPRQQARELLNS